MGVLGDDSGIIIPVSEDEGSSLGWLREGVQEGDNFLRQQFGYNKIDATQKMIMGEFPMDLRSADLSQVTDNEFGSIALQLQAQNTDTRPFFLFTTRNSAYDQQQIILNACAEHWWLSRQIDMRFRDAINGCLAGGSAAFWTTWNPDLRDFTSRYMDVRDVLPVRPWSYHSYQDCEAVIVRQERSVNELRRRWPQFADRIKADRDGSSAMTDEAETYSQRVIGAMGKSPFSLYREALQRVVSKMSGGTFPVADLFVAYIHDPRRNDSSSTLLMGPWSRDGKTPRRNWSYRVEPGELVYPGGRTIVATSTVRLYDGPNAYWHGEFPISKLTLDQWPFPKCYLGKAPLWDIIEEQRELNETQRAIGDHMRKFVEPDLVVDQNSGLSRSSAEKIRTRKAGGKFFKRPGPGEGFKFEYPPPLPPEVLTRPDAIIARMRSKAGTFDIANVLNKGQLPATETLDSILDIATGAIRARSRTLEAFVREVGGQMAYNFSQHYTKAMRFAIGGSKMVSIDDFDFDPGSLVPLHIGSDYETVKVNGSDVVRVRPEALENPRPRSARAKEFLRYFTFEVAPNSMLKSAHVDEEMKYLQLARAGFIDPGTLLEKMDIPNIGLDEAFAKFGGDPGTIMGRLLILSQLNLLGTVGPAGRKSSGQQPPMIKGSGAISESG